MKKLFILTLASLLMAACAEDVETTQNDARYITFNVTDQNYLTQPVEETRSAEASPFEGEALEFTPQNSLFTASATANTPTIDQTPVETDLDEDLCLITTVEDGIHLDNAAATTRGAQKGTGDNFTFGVSEFKNSDGSAITNLQNLELNTTAQPSTSQKVHTNRTWESDAAKSSPKYDFYAYSPYLSAATNGLTLDSGNKSITYDCSSIDVDNQQDLMTACATGQQYDKNGVNLAFGHRLCAVKIVLGIATTGCTINSIVFSNVIKSGTVSLADGSWSNIGSPGSYTVNGITQATQSSSAEQNVAVCLMMVPQTLSSCTLTITLTDANSLQHTLKATLSKTWHAGKTVTLTITPTAISSFTVKYPCIANSSGWYNSSTSSCVDGPVTAYTSGESFGLFAVDKNNNIVISNEQVTASASGNSVTLSTTANRFYSSQYTYYLYYPYQSDLTASGKSGYALRQGESYTPSDDDADTFFADVIGGWTVATDQSAADKSRLRASDLQIAKYNSGFAMVHRMGLLAGTIPAQTNADNVICYDGNTYNSSATGEKWTRIESKCTTIAWNASSTFTSSTNKPYNDGSTLYYIAKPADATISISATAGTQHYAWSVSEEETTVSTPNTYKTFTIATPDYSSAYNKKVWEFEYSISKTAKTWVAPTTGTYTLECWGAQGGEYTLSGYTAYGGRGAYVKGNISLTANNALFVYVGEKPTSSAGGWNGGGNNNGEKPAGGGGATDIAVQSGTWDSDAHLYSRIIVAGGGGGGGLEVTPNAWNGGAGGAWIGGDGNGPAKGSGGTLNSAGSHGSTGTFVDASFGKGGSGSWSSEPLGGGGGGWYGGGSAGGVSNNGGGGGGSSYAWSTEESLHTYYPSSIYKPSTTFYLTSLSKSAGERSGHGFAQITYAP